MFSFLSGGEKRTRKESHKPAWVGPPRPPVSGTCFARKNILRVFLLRSFSFCERKRTKKKAQKPAWVGPPRPPVSGACVCLQKIFCGAFLSEKPRREKQETDDGGGLPDGLRPNPTPLRFLFFGSFFSFPERKERTGEESENRRRQSSASGAPVCAARRRNSGFCDSMGSPCTHSGRNRSVQRSRLRRGRGGGGDGAAAMKRA